MSERSKRLAGVLASDNLERDIETFLRGRGLGVMKTREGKLIAWISGDVLQDEKKTLEVREAVKNGLKRDFPQVVIKNLKGRFNALSVSLKDAIL